ncbi:MAG: hypothetical protein EXS59_00130 [Candidatus Taylorbacteria bacterium]|nr:hypothetical protein [Candidatus Taylorbacteria bacterium]
MNQKTDDRPVLVCVFVPGVLQVGTFEELARANQTARLWDCPDTKGAPDHSPQHCVTGNKDANGN